MVLSWTMCVVVLMLPVVPGDSSECCRIAGGDPAVSK